VANAGMRGRPISPLVLSAQERALHWHAPCHRPLRLDKG
jgi:hypothetical protein